VRHPLLSVVFVALGLVGFGVAAYMAPRGLRGYYSFGAELILYGLLIAAGIGLYTRRAGGRIVALAFLRAGSFSIFLVPIGIVLWLTMLQAGKSNVLQVMGGLLFAALLLAAGPGKPETSPLWFVGGALAVLAVLSYLCARLYRGLAAEAHARPGGAQGSLERVLVMALAVAFIFIAFSAQKRATISDHDLPRALRKAETLAQEKKWAGDVLASLVGEPFLVDGRKGLFYVLNYDRGAVYVDVATGKAEKKDLPKEIVAHPYQSPQRPAARFTSDSSLFWSNRGSELVDLHTGRRLKPALEESYDRFLAIGFVDGSKRLLLFDKTGMRIVAVDTTTAQPVFSTDIAPPGGFSSEAYRWELLGRVVAGSAFSGDRSKLAWYYLDTLYLMDTATGAVESLALQHARDCSVYVSSDGRYVLTMKPYDTKPGWLVDLARKARVEHGIQGAAVLHFSATEGLVVNLPRADNSTNEMTLARWKMEDLALPSWTARFSRHWYAVVSADGKRLYSYNPDTHQMESAELAGLGGEAQLTFTPMPVTLPPGGVKWISYYPEAHLLVAVQSPAMAIIRLDLAGALASSTIVDFTPFNVRPE
jgi:hypothetical protein